MSWASYANYSAHGQKPIPILQTTLQGIHKSSTPEGIVAETIAGHYKPLKKVVKETGSEDFEESATNMLRFNRKSTKKLVGGPEE